MEVFGKLVIDKYRKGEIDTATFCDQYSSLYADDDDNGEDPLENDFNNDLFDLCVRYQDAIHNKAAVEKGLIESKAQIKNEINNLILEIEENGQSIKG